MDERNAYREVPPAAVPAAPDAEDGLPPLAPPPPVGTVLPPEEPEPPADDPFEMPPVPAAGTLWPGATPPEVPEHRAWQPPAAAPPEVAAVREPDEGGGYEPSPAEGGEPWEPESLPQPAPERPVEPEPEVTPGRYDPPPSDLTDPRGSDGHS